MTPPHLAPTKIRHPLRMRRIEVLQVVPLSATMQRILFTGADLHDFVTSAPDDHVKLFFPMPGKTDPALPDLAAGPAGPRNPDLIARDYTPRRFDEETGTLTIDFVLHDKGPATEWAAQARPGQHLGMGGPKASHRPSEHFTHHLLIGDDTALPAIGRTLEELQPHHKAIVVLDTRETDRTYTLQSHGRVDIFRCAPGQDLANLLRLIVLPSVDKLNVWIAAEIDLVRAVRDHLVQEEAIPRGQIRAAGYWRRNSAAGGARVED